MNYLKANVIVKNILCDRTVVNIKVTVFLLQFLHPVVIPEICCSGAVPVLTVHTSNSIKHGHKICMKFYFLFHSAITTLLPNTPDRSRSSVQNNNYGFVLYWLLFGDWGSFTIHSFNMFHSSLTLFFSSQLKLTYKVNY